jgi:hypothetical protein
MKDTATVAATKDAATKGTSTAAAAGMRDGPSRLKPLSAPATDAGQADARSAMQVLGRGGQAVARGSGLSQVLRRGAQAVERGSVPDVSQALGRGAEGFSRGAALPASCSQRQGSTRGDVPSAKWGR